MCVTNVTADYDRWALLKANEPLITQLQAYWKGALVRRAFSSRLDYLRAHEQQASLLTFLVGLGLAFRRYFILSLSASAR